MPEDNPKEVLSKFNIPQCDYILHPVKHGLINKSYAVVEQSTNEKVFFLQQIDHNVFSDIEGIMHNISIVINHFNSKTEAPGHLSPQQTSSGTNYYKSDEGEYWRLYNYVEGNTYYRAENEQIAAVAGKMFGDFLKALQGIDPDLMKTTIRGFHDIDLRYEQFKKSLTTAKPARKDKANALIGLTMENINYVKGIYHEILNTCPARVTHNDTKLSNLLFDQEQKGICVVDYDTLMPGYLALDYGDSVRTICSTTVEDDTNLASTYYDIEIFKSFTTNFIDGLASTITNEEINLFAKAAAYMPFLMGIRMLTDYLNNDVYYNTQYEQHNFDRASNQLALFVSGAAQLNEMNNIVHKTLNIQSS
jgi:hypothetical protein